MSGKTGQADAGAAGGRNPLWLMLSYCFNRTWSFTFLFSAVLFSALSAEQSAQTMGELFRTSLFIHAVCLAGCALAHTYVLRLLEHAVFPYLGPALTGLGLVLLFSPLREGVPCGDAAMMASSALTGLGSCLTVLLMGKRFVGISAKECMLTVLLAGLASSLLTMVVSLLPFELAFAATVAVPFASVYFAQKVDVPQPDEPSRFQSLGERISRGMVLRLVACTGVIGIITGVFRDLYTYSAAVAFDLYSQLILGFAVSAVCLAAYALTSRAKPHCIDEPYKLAVLVCTAGFSILPLLGADSMAPFVLVSAGYTLFEFVVWTIFCELAKRFQYTSIQVFGYGRALTNIVGVITGQILSIPLVNIDFDTTLLSGIAGVSVMLIAFMRTYILGSSDLAQLEMSLAADPSFEAQTEPDGGSAEAQESSQKAEKKVPFQKKCLIIGEYYNLTRRETDVFRLLAAGRNSTRIQEELCISLGTVNTHSHHVFQKLGVHKQQEVIDLLEAADLDAIQAELAKRGAAGR